MTTVPTACIALVLGLATAAIGQTTTTSPIPTVASTTTSTVCGGEPPPEVRREAEAHPDTNVSFQCGGVTYSFGVHIDRSGPVTGVRHTPRFTG
jgi:hypothetical protein